MDEPSRRRLSALADAAREELDPEARARIASVIAQQGPGLIRRARVQRRVMTSAAGVAVFGLVAWVAMRQPVAPEVAAVPQAAPAPMTSPVPAVVPAPARACATREPMVDAADLVATVADGPNRFELGLAGSLALLPGGHVTVDSHDPCRTAIELHEGRVVVHAADLGGGELRVQTKLGDVVVHGTVFAVELRDASLAVDVDEGRVGVEPRAGASTSVTPGQRVIVASGAPVRVEELPRAARDAMRVDLGMTAVVPAAVATRISESDAGRNMPPSAARPLPRSRVDTPAQAARLISEADELWKRGELATARERYREAGGVRDATGESAWLALARRELSRGDTAAAHAALREHDRRFQNGTLTGESLGIAFRVAQTEHDVDGARRIALQLVSHYAHTAQGKAAQRWLDETH